jgi:hypothetical protein
MIAVEFITLWKRSLNGDTVAEKRMIHLGASSDSRIRNAQMQMLGSYMMALKDDPGIKDHFKWIGAGLCPACGEISGTLTAEKEDLVACSVCHKNLTVEWMKVLD